MEFPFTLERTVAGKNKWKPVAGFVELAHAKAFVFMIANEPIHPPYLYQVLDRATGSRVF